MIRTAWEYVYGYFHWGYQHRTPVAFAALVLVAALAAYLVVLAASRIVHAARARLGRRRTDPRRAVRATARRERHLESWRAASNAQINRRLLAIEPEFALLQPLLQEFEDADDKEGSR